MSLTKNIYPKLEVAIICFIIYYVSVKNHDPLDLSSDQVIPKNIPPILLMIIYMAFIIALIAIFSNIFRLIFIVFVYNPEPELTKKIRRYRVFSILTFLVIVFIAIIFRMHPFANDVYISDSAYFYLNTSLMIASGLFYVYTIYIDLTKKAEVNEKTLVDELHENS